MLQYINRAVCPGSSSAERRTQCAPPDTPGDETGSARPPGLHLKQGLLDFDGTPQAEYVALVAAANRKYGF
eukprot:COSAG04_NODE_491_length_13463_cov_5.877432_17_plen_71_part_00